MPMPPASDPSNGVGLFWTLAGPRTSGPLLNLSGPEVPGPGRLDLTERPAWGRHPVIFATDSGPPGTSRYIPVILTVTAEKLSHRLYGLGETDALDGDAGGEGAEQAAG